jgi:hypothetical protein
MLLRTEDTPCAVDNPSQLQQVLDLAADLTARYEISALSGLLASARASIAQSEIGVAVLGRFKAGKTSFLNHFMGCSILPVGVVPVTAVVTEIRYGPREEARVHHRDGRYSEVPLDRIGSYISEKENPENHKQAGLIAVGLPELRRFRGLKFVDTPGLDSALSHNTQTSLDWLPIAEIGHPAAGMRGLSGTESQIGGNGSLGTPSVEGSSHRRQGNRRRSEVVNPAVGAAFRGGNAVHGSSRRSFVTPLYRVRKQAFRALQQFRDRLSDRAMRAFGVPLRTTETEIDVVEAATPDIRVGRVFDRNWELLSPVLPVWTIKRAVQQLRGDLNRLETARKVLTAEAGN